MNRKQFFKELVCLSFDAFESLQTEKTSAVLSDTKKRVRPPGAHPDEEQFISRCTGCDACMTACPVHVIMIENLENRDPLLYPDQDPCIHCPGTPCITACSTGALDRQFGTHQRLLCKP